jgi:hypothetical protein
MTCPHLNEFPYKIYTHGCCFQISVKGQCREIFHVPFFRQTLSPRAWCMETNLTLLKYSWNNQLPGDDYTRSRLDSRV